VLPLFGDQAIFQWGSDNSSTVPVSFCLAERYGEASIENSDLHS